MTESDWHRSTDPSTMLAVLTDRGASERKRRLFAAGCCRRVEHLLTDPRVRNALALVEQHVDGLVRLEVLVGMGQELGAAVEDAWVARYDAEADANFCSHPAYSAALATEAAVNAVGGLFDDITSGVAPPTLDRGFHAERSAHENAVWAAKGAADAFTLRATRTVRSPEPRLKAHERGEQFAERVRRDELAAQADLLRCIFGNPFRPASRDGSWRTSTAVALARQMYETRDFTAMPVLADALMDAGCDDERVLNHCRGPGVHVRGCHVVDLVLGKT